MAITDDWRLWINELAKTRKVIAVEMQGHGRTADVEGDFSYENLADDVIQTPDGLLKLDRHSAARVGCSLLLGGNVTFNNRLNAAI